MSATPDGQGERKRCYMSPQSMAAIVSPLSGRGITPFHALKMWPLQCAKGTHGYGLPRVPDAIGAIDCTNAGLQRKARVWEREQGRRREMGREKESAEGMCPQGACLGLGQGFRNAPQEIPVKARAGLEECFSWELRVEAGWGRARGMFPQSTPLTREQKWRGSTGGALFPVPPPAPGWLWIRFPCGDQHPADRALGCPGE